MTTEKNRKVMIIKDRRPESQATGQASSMRDRRRCTSSNGLLFRIVLILCYVTMIYGDIKFYGMKELQKTRNQEVASSNLALLQPGFCDLENESCDWAWNETKSFSRIAAPKHRDELYPMKDADMSRQGHFLWFRGPGHAHMWSKQFPKTEPSCKLEFRIYYVEMMEGSITLIIDTNEMRSVAASKLGNNNKKWEVMRFNLGVIIPPYVIFLEMYAPYWNSTISVDNIRLVDCFPEFTPVGVNCSVKMFRCNNGSCLNKTRVCDFTKDCEDGEDEEFECDKIPENARCNFEDGWCGWENVKGRPMNWTLNSGPPETIKFGPTYDHTYLNKTGTYAMVNMYQKGTQYGSRSTIESPLYNPTPPYSSDPNSIYYRSCQIRFFYHQYQTHTGSLGLYLVQLKPFGNDSTLLWWSYQQNNNRDNNWHRNVVALPNIRYRYYFQFEASKGYSSKGDCAIDDISLSPECFAIGVPQDVVGNFDYYNPIIESEKVPTEYPDFANKTDTVIRITTCGATGRMGPTAEQCAGEYNETSVELIVPPWMLDHKNTPDFNISGIQRWTAPRGDYYTLIGIGARGGKDSSGKSNSLGALVRGVIELEKGDQLYFIVGQGGTDACPKNLGLSKGTCPSSSQFRNSSSKLLEVKKLEFKNGGGGGGGATVVFMLKSNGEPEPILIAGGGGGLDSSTENGLQHGQGAVLSSLNLPPSSGKIEDNGTGGIGASWDDPKFNNSDERNHAGMPLILGGLGGFGCETGNQSHGNGGFGGGGGGCNTGGGGGGYKGGNAGYVKLGSGEGGSSYASPKLTNSYFKTAINYGPGEIMIIPAISGCNCDYRCVALDRYLSEVKCICPQGWLLDNDLKSCIMISNSISKKYVIALIVVSCVVLTVGIGIILYLLVDKIRQKKKELLLSRQTVPGTELTALHDDRMMTEINPNYEFAGNLYSIKDLPQIPRDHISLVKPVGQGAFGEVYQGVYKYSHGEAQPIAVKTLPLSSAQAEMDFILEAFIMSKFNHANIVHFIGISFDKHPRYIVLELLAGGDLKNFLREERPRPDRPTSLTMYDLIMCANDVANGCKYMEEMHFIHRDIAARNCLLTTKESGRTVKVADFGMARDIYRNDYYRKDGKAMLPIKWMSPESFLDGCFSSKADVWAFGVLLWEIMSFGYMPYTGCANVEVMRMVSQGGRLEKPVGCPDPLYGIMMQCWNPEAKDRPNFSTIIERIGYCLQDPDVINHPPPNFDKLPFYDPESTIMRPDSEAECINIHCTNMQPEPEIYLEPKVVDPKLGGQPAENSGNEMSNRSDESRDKTPRPTECLRGKFGCNTYYFSTDAFDQSYNSDKNRSDSSEMTEDCEGRCLINRPKQDARKMYGNYNEDRDDLKNNANNGNNCPEDERGNDCCLNDNAITDRRNGNESTTTSDTNSDSLIAQSSDTPPDTTTNSSPNTRTCSPNRNIGLNANVNVNVNGMVRKNTLKATLSLDPSALCRTVPYEKITKRTQHSSTPGSIELRKDSLNHKLPREEECSC